MEALQAELAALRAELPMLLLVPEDTAAVAGLCAELQTPLRHAKTLRQRTLVRPLVPRLAAQPDELDVPGVRCALRGARYACSVPSCAQRFRLESQMEAHVAMHHSLGPARSAGPAPLTWDQVDSSPVELLPLSTTALTPAPRLPAALMPVFGHQPLVDPCELAVCPTCSARMLPHRLAQHVACHPSATSYTAPKASVLAPAAKAGAPARGRKKPSLQSLISSTGSGTSSGGSGAGSEIFATMTWRQLSVVRQAASPPSDTSTDDSSSFEDLKPSVALGTKVKVNPSSRHYDSLRSRIGVVSKVPVAARDSWYGVQMSDSGEEISFRLRDLDVLPPGNTGDPRPDHASAASDASGAFSSSAARAKKRMLNTASKRH